MERLAEDGHFFEGARWRDGYWWVSDLYAHHVRRIAPDGTSTVAARLDCQPSGLGWLPDGRLLIVAMEDMRIMRLEADGSLVVHAELRDHVGFWANDMVVDSRGHAYVSNMGFNLWIGARPQPADLVCAAPDGTVRTVASDLLFPNGMVVSPDGSTLVVAETFGNRLSAFTIADDGSLSDRRTFAQFGPAPSWASIEDFVQEDFGPDGCAIDAEGCVWVADALHNRICRVADGGAILEELRTPEGFGIYSCALGGPDGHSLLMCTAPDYAEAARKAKAEAVLYVEHVAVPAAA